MLQKLSSSIMVRFGLIGALILLMLIPLSFVSDLIVERKNRNDQAVTEIADKWGGAQNIIGPVLVVPYTYTAWERVTEGENEKVKMRPVLRSKRALLFPDDLKIKGDLKAQKRKRGIYQAVLYSTSLKVSGEFTLPDFKQALPNKKIKYGEAYIAVGVSDTRGIQSQIELNWDGKTKGFKPGTGGVKLFPTGIHSIVNLSAKDAKRKIKYNFPLQLQGSKSIRFAPLGKKTNVSLNSNWSDPGFQGAYLPTERKITDKGFQSKWLTSYFGRNFPQFIETENQNIVRNIHESSFGVDLVITVDQYQKANRAAKYGLLFFTLTFMAYVFFEIFSRLKLHPLQYLLVGSALIIFYVMFISLSEHMPFTGAYMISSLAIVGLITTYSLRVLGTLKRALLLALMLTGLYTYLYVVLMSQDYALLLGSLALFVLLAVIMFTTRNIDWYGLKLGTSKPEGEEPVAT